MRLGAATQNEAEYLGQGHQAVRLGRCRSLQRSCGAWLARFVFLVERGSAREHWQNVLDLGSVARTAVLLMKHSGAARGQGS